MLANRRFSLQRVSTPWLASVLFLAMSCGGKESASGRPVGDSDNVKETAVLTDCQVEDALLEKQYLPRAEFEDVAATGWGASTDKSPQPATAPRAITRTCPEDSNRDCCLFGDMTEAEVQAQAPYQKNCPDETAPMCRAFSGSIGTQAIDKAIACRGSAPTGKALHVRAARFTDWGAQIYYSFSPARDASQFDGVSFWVRRGKGGTQPVGESLFIVFDDRFTKELQDKYKLKVDENGAYVLEPNANGDLAPVFETDPVTGERILEYPAYSTTVPAKTCYDVNVDAMKCDRFGAGVGLEPEWRFVKIPFDSMRQRGYGVKSPAGRVLKEELLAFGIYMDVGNWDFWIDQIAFYKDAP